MDNDVVAAQRYADACKAVRACEAALAAAEAERSAAWAALVGPAVVVVAGDGAGEWSGSDGTPVPQVPLVPSGTYLYAAPVPGPTFVGWCP